MNEQYRDGVDADALLADLDADQRRAVTTDQRLVAVVAGAGSGKTRVLTRRVAWRVATETADARHTLVLTFTREAAGELRRRLPRLGLNERVQAGTFHGVAAGLLRQRWADLGRRELTIRADRHRMIREIAESDQIEALLREIDWACTRGFDDTTYPRAVVSADHRPAVSSERVAATLREYRTLKRRRGVVDFDDLLAELVRELDRDPAYADAVRWRHRHVLVDEAQDLNPLQHRLIDALRVGTDDLFLVGDPAQAIFGFTGSDPGLLVDVEDRFPGVEVIRLPVNHRCTPQIVAAGAHVLLRSGATADVVSDRPDGAPVAVARHDDEHAEAATTATAIARSDPDLVRRGQVAVLARTHATLAAVRSALAAAGVAVAQPSGATGGSPLLRAATGAESNDTLRGWLDTLAEQVEQAKQAEQDEQDDATDGPRGNAGRGETVRIPESAGGRDAAAQVVDVVRRFLREQPSGDGRALRSWLDALDPLERAVRGVELLTFHAAKGREWHTVHLVGCESSLVPHRSATTVEGRAEEARLFYVALTRATDVAAVHWAARRGGYQRRPTPLLTGFDAAGPAPVPPPVELLTASRRTDDSVLVRLRAWRDRTAHASGLTPEAVCSDRVLALIDEHRPSSADELDAVTGVGALTARRWFDGIATALST